MKYLNKIFMVLSIFLFAFSCNNPVKVTSIETVTGNYKYTGYDSNNVIITEGSFSINIKDSTQIIGSWNFNKVNNSQNCGPQYGNGNLIGNINDDEIWIGLNPNNADNNIELIGLIKSNKFSGNWHYISFIGVTNTGKFEAVKINGE